MFITINVIFEFGTAPICMGYGITPVNGALLIARVMNHLRGPWDDPQSISH